MKSIKWLQQSTRFCAFLVLQWGSQLWKNTWYVHIVLLIILSGSRKKCWVYTQHRKYYHVNQRVLKESPCSLFFMGRVLVAQGLQVTSTYLPPPTYPPPLKRKNVPSSFILMNHEQDRQVLLLFFLFLFDLFLCRSFPIITRYWPNCKQSVNMWPSKSNGQ